MLLESRGLLIVEQIIDEAHADYWRYKFYACGAQAVSKEDLDKIYNDPSVTYIGWFDHPLVEQTCIVVRHDEGGRDFIALYIMKPKVFRKFVETIIHLDWRKDGF